MQTGADCSSGSVAHGTMPATLALLTVPCLPTATTANGSIPKPGSSCHTSTVPPYCSSSSAGLAEPSSSTRTVCVIASPTAAGGCESGPAGGALQAASMSSRPATSVFAANEVACLSPTVITPEIIPHGRRALTAFKVSSL